MIRSVLLLALLPLPVLAAVDFSHQIAPLLKQQCGECHLGEKKKGGFSMNTRTLLLEGSENGGVVTAGKAAESKLLEVLTSTDPDVQMPPKGKRVPADQVAILKQWINEGLAWEDGFTFGKSSYDPPLKPREVILPPATEGRTHPIDRILDAYMTQHKVTRPAQADDTTFIRRLSMDVLGLLPSPQEVDTFVINTAPDKRQQLIKQLLARDVDYTEHWLTFWNDLLRNDYVGTGYIDGGRKQITNYLYQALITNQPYDDFVRGLIAPSAGAEGFINGIKWRGNVNASQVREVQFAQSISQVFLGINMKCASCHDSFIDRWKLDEAYNLAAIYSDHPLEVNRCDKPTGRMAKPAWIFPELGDVKPDAPQPERLKQLAALMTHPQNGRFTRTIVNRIWHRLMGHGIVHPVDAMHTEPWSADLLDHLANHFREQHCDLKELISYIASSQAYQSRTSTAAAAPEPFVYSGPIARRLTAEQFVDAVWRLTSTGPKAAHGSVLRGRPDPTAKASGQWIWSNAGAKAAAGETITLRKRFTLADAPLSAKAVVTADNEYKLIINAKLVGEDTDLTTVETYPIGTQLRKGVNTVLYVIKNGGKGPNAAGAWFEASVQPPAGEALRIATDATWEWTSAVPDDKGKFATEPTDWKPAMVCNNQATWERIAGKKIEAAISQGGAAVPAYVRASLVTADLLQRALGRPNREQIVTVRPENLTTLEAIDLANGNTLASYLKQGAAKLAAEPGITPEVLAKRLFQAALSRKPSDQELAAAKEMLSPKAEPQAVEDLLWSLLMLPEFEFVR